MNLNFNLIFLDEIFGSNINQDINFDLYLPDLSDSNLNQDIGFNLSIF